MKQQQLLDRIASIGIIPVIKINEAEDALPLAKALIDGGLDCAEITFRSEHALSSIRAITQAYPTMLVGAGTVLTIEQAKQAIEAGAQFIVTPGFNPDLVEWCMDLNICILPGVSSATEVEMALRAGITHVKFFPAQSNGGAAKIKDLSAPYSSIKFMPTGGVTLSNLHDYLSLPCVDAVGGSFMLNAEAIERKDWDEIKRSTQIAVKELLSYRLIHLGINTKDAEDAHKTANLLCHLFHFEYYPKPKSDFASVSFEIMHGKGPGEHGHIGIYTPYPEKAMYQLKKLGIHFKEETISRNKKTNRINFVYLDLELNGFGIHLINPDVKMV